MKRQAIEILNTNQPITTNLATAMDIRTFRAKTMPAALDMISRELGPAATVLHTRELRSGLMGRLLFGRQYEVAAAATTRDAKSSPHRTSAETTLRRKPQSDQQRSTLARLHAELVDADVDEEIARQLIEELQAAGLADVEDLRELRSAAADAAAKRVRTAGPIRLTPGTARVVALVGPTGVGKTTTVAKLAANYRLRSHKRVALITVDTYRIAAVEQLRTYADIIDLPMEVVGTPHEMRAAVDKMRDFDLVLMDTAGRSPRDEVRIRELQSILSAAEPHEVHLVLSAASSARNLATTVERFSPVGVTATIVTKLDEADSLGHLLAISASGETPISYVTNGQNVPDDISLAEAEALAPLMVQAAA